MTNIRKASQQFDRTEWFVSHASGCELMHAQFKTHSFPAHWHSTYVLEVVESGVDEFFCEDRIYRAHAGEIVLIGPGIVHSGRPSGRKPLSYRSFYVPPATFRDAYPESGTDTLPRFSTPVLRDAPLAKRLLAVHKGVQSSGMQSDGAATTTDFRALLRQLVECHSDHRKSKEAANGCITPNSARVASAMRLLQDSNRKPWSIEDLARACGLSPFHFVRLFKKTTGLPPHQYQLNQRLERGRSLLAQGDSICTAALRSGFADQSHFTRHFRKFFGVTPGAYLSARTFKTRTIDQLR